MSSDILKFFRSNSPLLLPCNAFFCAYQHGCNRGTKVKELQRGIGSDIEANMLSRICSRLVAMGWDGVATVTPGQQGASFLASPEIFLQIYIVAIS